MSKLRITNYVLRFTFHVSRFTPLLLLCLAFTLLVLMHSAATPVFEAPDEVWHYAYVRWLAEGHGLPAMDNDDSGANQEVAQPPLYYAVAALFSAPFSDDDLDALGWGNPGFGTQAEGAFFTGTPADNKNMIIHTEREAFPWRGAALAIHVTRFASLLFGLLAVVAAWGLGHETFGTRRGALITAALVAFHPQFVFLSSVVSNDSAAAALCTAALWMLARILRRGLTARRAAIVGALAGLCALTKTSALAMVGLAGAVVMWQGWQQRSIVKHQTSDSRFTFYVLRFTFHPLLYAGVVLLVGGWWYGRNFALYGDPLGISNHTGTPWGRPAPVALLALLPEMPLLLRSFWAAYGWGHVFWADWVYWILWIFSGYYIVRAAYCEWRVRSGELRVRSGELGVRSGESGSGNPHGPLSPPLPLSPSPPLLLPFLWFIGILGALLQWMRQVQAPHGRLLFPALGAWALIVAAGMGQEARGKRQEARSKKLISYLLSPISYLLLLFLLSALAPGARILATFAPPRLRAPEAVLAALKPINYVYEGQARLLGIAPEPGLTFYGRMFMGDGVEASATGTERATPGDVLDIKACWEAAQPMTTDYTVFVHLIGPENSRVAERHTYPGLGRFPTSLWPVGRAFCDTYRLAIEPWAEGPIRYQLEIGLFDAATGERLRAQYPDGVHYAEPPIVGNLVVAPETPSAFTSSTASDAILDSLIRLRGYDAPLTAAVGSDIPVSLDWEALAAPGEYLIAFVHLWRPGDAQPLAQDDGPPRDGWSPTDIWQPGDVIRDAHTLRLPADLLPGDYPLWAGMYRPGLGVRLEAVGSEGRYLHDLIPIGTLHISAAPP